MKEARADLLNCTRRILLTEGYDAMSIKRVAEECDVGMGTIYNHYPAKVDLIGDVMRQDWVEKTNEMNKGLQVSGSCADSFALIVTTLSDFAALYRDVFRAFIHKGKADIVDEYHGMLREFIRNTVNEVLEIQGYGDEKEHSGLITESLISAGAYNRTSIREIRCFANRVFPPKKTEEE